MLIPGCRGEMYDGGCFPDFRSGKKRKPMPLLTEAESAHGERAVLRTQ